MYWERFNKLCVTCLHHQINEQLLIQYFYEGLMMMDQNMIDAGSGEALMDKTPAAARNLISSMASNTWHFGTRAAAAFKVTASYRTTSHESNDKSVWHLYFCGAPNQCVPHIAGIKSENAEIVGLTDGHQHEGQLYESR
ncbi:hypothetical protein CR513_19681, partial [Mucuna pruriens]